MAKGNRVYRGLRVEKAGGCLVTADGVQLNPRHDLRNHSPDGFNWGYGGSGPAQLALALCASVLGNDRNAQLVYQAFKWAWVSTLEADEWEVEEVELLRIIGELVSKAQEPVLDAEGME